MRAHRLAVALALVAAAGCAADLFGELDLAATVCADGPTVRGIDVSTWQGAIDWTRSPAQGSPRDMKTTCSTCRSFSPAIRGWRS